jgi:hypothetical protein
MCADWGIDSMGEYPELEVPMPMVTVSLTRRRGDTEKDAEKSKRRLEVRSSIPAFGGWHAETAEDRRKIGDDPAEPRYLRNVRGLGYRFDG